MKSRNGLLWAFVLGVLVFTPTIVRAGDPMIDALAAIPEDAIGFACLPSLEQLDADYRQAIVDLGVQELVPPMAQSLLMPLKMVPMFMTVDTKQPVIIVAMPAKTMAELGQSAALILPTSDPKPILTGMMGQESDDGTWKVNVFGTPMHAATGPGKLILASTPEMAKHVAGSTKSYASKLTKEQKGFLEKLDVVVWVEAPPLIEMFRPQIDGLVMMAMMSNMGQGAVNEDGARAQKEQIEMLLSGMAGVGVGVAVDRVGLDLRFGMTAKKDSELSKQMAGVASSRSLLRGLPSEDFLIAMGVAADPEQTKESIAEIDPAFAMLEADTELDKEKLNKLKEAVKEWIVLFAGARGSIHFLPEDGDGLIGAAAVIETTDSKRWMELLDQMAGIGVELISIPEFEEDFKEFVAASSFTMGAEEIAKAQFAHWMVDVAKLEEVDDEKMAALKKLFGEDGLLVRIGAVNDKTVVFAFGGGESHVKKLIETARSGRDVIGESAGVKKVSAELPSQKSMAMYIAADRIVTLIKRVTKVLGEEDEIPFDVPRIDAPITIVGSGAAGWTRADLYIPMEVGAACATVAKEMKAKEEAEAKAAKEAAAKEASEKAKSEGAESPE